ncbi:hypothetical protein CU097_009048 [Rhizopus azygosporus]|uniref:Uncharacterized protein n=1 Tax=Rhizopus azygosporus TaxID=86630 RepID=A0A367JDR7_RHIAZ|nr:hypothetical protein CU097_009048 [Rhizopus azygosporus]
MLPMWSTEDNANTGPALFGIWYKRYRQKISFNNFVENQGHHWVTAKMNSAGVSFDMYDEAKNAAFSYDPVHEVMKFKKTTIQLSHLEFIIDKSRRRKRLKSSYHEDALDLLTQAQYSATEEGRRLLNLGTVAFHSTDSGEIAADENAQVVDEADKGDSSYEATQISTENHEIDISLDLLEQHSGPYEKACDNSFIEELISPNKNRNNKTIIIKRHKLSELLNLRTDEAYVVDTAIRRP